MSNMSECACTCYDAPICVAYVFNSNNDCYRYKTLTQKIPETTAEAYIKRNRGNNYLGYITLTC